MTEKIIKKENVEYKLTCSLFIEWNRPAKYRFKLQQREIGKRKWKDLKGEECDELENRCDEWICRLIDCKYFVNRGKVTDVKIDKEE